MAASDVTSWELRISIPHKTATAALVIGSAALIVSTYEAADRWKLRFVIRNPSEK
jgi:hypothetical protein